MLNIVIVLFIGTVSSNELGGIICRMGKNIGFECVGNSPRQSAFYFDSDIGQCIEFEFRGCGGNFNRFSTMEECQAGCRSMTKCKKGFPLTDFAGNIKRCDGDRLPCPGGFECVGLGMESVCCKLADRVCSTSVDMGNSCGIAAKIRFYFDPVSNLCRPFNFLGCGVAANVFNSVPVQVGDEHQGRACSSSSVLCQKGDPLPDRFSSSRVARCHHDAHCPKNYTCVGSNRQHKTCCPSREFICKLPYDTKLACHRPQLTKELWTFNVQSGTCENISLACSDQLNTFASREQCSDFCIGQCPDGLHTHRNPSNGLPQLCDVQQQYGCPLGFECLQMYN